MIGVSVPQIKRLNADAKEKLISFVPRTSLSLSLCACVLEW
jgi:hypothetical protein